MKLYYLLLILFVLVESSQSNVIQSQKPINQTCLNYGLAHDCRFYQCFNERFPCNSNNWVLNWGYKYCHRMEQTVSSFDANGQQLMKQVASCLIKKLLQQHFYTYRSIDCEQLRKAAQKLTHDCYLSNAKLFCTAIQGKNRDCFFQFIDDDDRHDLSLIRTLSHVGQKCTPKIRWTDMRSHEKTDQCLINKIV